MKNIVKRKAQSTKAHKTSEGMENIQKLKCANHVNTIPYRCTKRKVVREYIDSTLQKD